MHAATFIARLRDMHHSVAGGAATHMGPSAGVPFRNGVTPLPMSCTGMQFSADTAGGRSAYGIAASAATSSFAEVVAVQDSRTPAVHATMHTPGAQSDGVPSSGQQEPRFQYREGRVDQRVLDVRKRVPFTKPKPGVFNRNDITFHRAAVHSFHGTCVMGRFPLERFEHFLAGEGVLHGVGFKRGHMHAGSDRMAGARVQKLDSDCWLENETWHCAYAGKCKLSHVYVVAGACTDICNQYYVGTAP
jgi:hypothetical protein